MTRHVPHLARPGLPLAVLLVLASACPRAASAQPSGSALGRALAEYDARRYRLVITLLRPMLYPRSRLTSEDEEASAYTLLGKSYWWLGQLEKPGPTRHQHLRDAEQQFSALLSLKPRARLSALIHPKELVLLFERVRKRLTASSSPLKALETELKHCRKSIAGERRRFTAYRRACASREVEVRTVTKRYYFWNFVPFGAGQFQNGHTLKGALFAAGQSAMLLMNISGFIVAETNWVRNGPNRTIRDDLASRSRAADIQKVQIASGVLFWSMVAWGIVDALVFYKKTTITRDRKLIPLGNANVELMPEVGRDRLMLGLTARF